MIVNMSPEEGEAVIYALALRYVQTNQLNAVQQKELVMDVAVRLETEAVRGGFWDYVKPTRFEHWVNDVMKRVTVTNYDTYKPRRV